MNARDRGRLGYRAVFGAGFIAFGIVLVYRVAIHPAPFAAKIIGMGFAVALLALGCVRVATWWRYRNEGAG